MGVLLFTDDTSPPPWPAIFCVGDAALKGRGWAWHDDEARRRCFGGLEIAASADVVAAAIDGRDLPGVDRALAIVALSEETGTRMLRRVFRPSCPHCGGNHAERATAALRAIRGTRQVHAYVHKGAIDALRSAHVPERYLYQPRIIRPKAEEKPSDRYSAHLPLILGDAERTRLAQIAFAQRYEARRNRRC